MLSPKRKMKLDLAWLKFFYWLERPGAFGYFWLLFPFYIPIYILCMPFALHFVNSSNKDIIAFKSESTKRVLADIQDADTAFDGEDVYYWFIYSFEVGGVIYSDYDRTCMGEENIYDHIKSKRFNKIELEIEYIESNQNVTRYFHAKEIA